MPQLKQQPARWDWSLLVRLALLPLTLSVAVGHVLLETGAGLLVHLFPQLQPAAAGFEERTLIGQWLALCAMTLVLLPAHLLSTPLQTVKHLLDMLVQTVKSMLAKPVQAVEQLMALVREYADKMWTLVTDIYHSNISETVEWLRALAVYTIGWIRSWASRVLSVVRDLLDRLLTPLRSAVAPMRHPLASLKTLVYHVAAGAMDMMQTVAGMLRQGVTSVLAVTLATLETAYFVVFQATGLHAWLQWLLKTAQAGGSRVGHRINGALPTMLRPYRAPVSTSAPGSRARTQRRDLSAAAEPCRACGAERAADAATTAKDQRQLDPWGWRRLAGALLLTLTVAVAALALVLARCV